ncbi:MAG: hypothetical protein GX628_08645 [Clostridiales bacterium]|nr:hypothetical protein [Clostridiales bacterium]
MDIHDLTKRLPSIAAAVAILLTASLGGCSRAVPEPLSGQGSEWIAGYGVTDLVPPSSNLSDYYVAGYRNGNRATGLLDYQQACAMWLETGGASLLLVAVDCVALAKTQTDEIKDRIYAAYDGDKSALRIHIISTHDHAGIDTFGLWGELARDGKDEGFMEVLYQGVVKAALDAYADRRPGELYYGHNGKGIEELQRDSRNPQIYDREIHQLRFEPSDGSPGIRLLDYAAHAESLRGANSLISADYPRYLREAVERDSPGKDRALYVPGAVGGLIMTHVLRDDNGEEYPVETNVVLTGELLAKTALAIKNERKLEPRLWCDTTAVRIPLDNTLFILMAAVGVLPTRAVESRDGKYGLSVETVVSLVRIGDLSLVMIPGEYFPELAYGDTGPGIPNTSKIPNPPPLKDYLGEDFLIVGLSDDEIGYIVTPSDFLLHKDYPYIKNASEIYEIRHYEETNSVGPDAAKHIADAVARLCERAGLWQPPTDDALDSANREN